MSSTRILRSIVQDIEALARDQATPKSIPDIELLVSRDMRMIIGEAMSLPSSPHQITPHALPAYARITTLWAADGCFAIVRLRGLRA